MVPEDSGRRPPVPGPLVGVRVLDLATLYAAPLLAAMLGDLGADVVKVEPPAGDDLRRLAAGQERPGVWSVASRNKRMVCLDPASDADRRLLHRLTAAADVVVLNQSRRVLEEMGCTYEDIAGRAPGAVVVNTTTFGSTGPWADRPGNGSLAEAFGGLTGLLRDADGRPLLTPVLFGDHLTAMAGALGVLAALYWRDARDGRGQHIDLTQYEAVMACLAPQIAASESDNPSAEGPGRTSGLRGTFRTGDGTWVAATAYSEAQLRRLSGVLGLGEEPGRGRTDLVALVTEWISSHDRPAVLEAFSRARVQVSPVHEVDGLPADPQVRHRHSVTEVPHPRFGSVRLPAPAPRLADTPSTVRWSDRARGEDTESVLEDWLA